MIYLQEYLVLWKILPHNNHTIFQKKKNSSAIELRLFLSFNNDFLLSNLPSKFQSPNLFFLPKHASSPCFSIPVFSRPSPSSSFLQLLPFIILTISSRILPENPYFQSCWWVELQLVHLEPWWLSAATRCFSWLAKSNHLSPLAPVNTTPLSNPEIRSSSDPILTLVYVFTGFSEKGFARV